MNVLIFLFRLTILTTIPIKIPSTIPTTVLTTIPIIKQTTIITNPLTTINKIVPYIPCNYYNLIQDLCNLANCTSAECLYELIKKEIIQTIPEGSDNLYFNTSNNYTLQITSVNNELESLNRNTTGYLSVIDLAECADILKR